MSFGNRGLPRVRSLVVGLGGAIAFVYVVSRAVLFSLPSFKSHLLLFVFVLSLCCSRSAPGLLCISAVCRSRARFL
ncbi:hypothetical protein BV20DRAFT_967819 [Pilatotrama ljubarskyi]|nr:hypothetical protein BV20DRAFT_967819 [Pilatotrama ljubarskyi]